MVPKSKIFWPLWVDFRPPGSHFSLPEGCEMAFQRLPGASWGPGRRQEGTLGDLGRKRVRQKIVWTALGVVLGPSWPLLGPFWVGSPPPGRSSGRYFLKDFSEVKPRAAKMSIFYSFSCFWVPGSLLYVVLCCLACCAPGGLANMEKS